MCFDPAAAHGLGAAYNIQNRLGSDLSAAEVEACVFVLKEGDAVDIKRAKMELPLAVTVAVMRNGLSIIGVGAIKRPRPYARKIASTKYSGFSFDPQLCELGYVAVLKAYRGGQSGRIVDALLKEFKGSLWATTFNKLMKFTLKHRGFVQRGREWLSVNGKDRVSLWIKESK